MAVCHVPDMLWFRLQLVLLGVLQHVLQLQHTKNLDHVTLFSCFILKYFIEEIEK